MSARRLLLAVFGVMAAFNPMQQRVSAQHPTGIVISEYRFRGAAGVADEFVEIYNGGQTDVDISGWMLRASNNNSPPNIGTRATVPPGTTLRKGCFFLFTNAGSGGFSGGVAPDATFSIGIADDGSIALTTTSITEFVDRVGQGTHPNAFGEGNRLPPTTSNSNRGVERRPGGAQGHIDTDDNLSDFREIIPANPQNLASTCLNPGTIALTASASPSPVEQGSQLAVFGRVHPGTVPPSTGVQVMGDLSAFGGSTAALFLDNGVSPDVTADDNVFSAAVNVSATHLVGSYSLTLSVRDAERRSFSSTITVDVIEPPVINLPHDIQGAGAVSPIAIGTPVMVSGVVTARSSTGFFIQTEVGREDAHADTSEGLFVSVIGGAPAAAVLGNLVSVRGEVAEFVPAAEGASAPRTEVDNVTAVNDLGPSSVPDPYPLTSVEVSANGGLDQLERFEGMRVVASLTAVSGTGGVRDEVAGSAASDGAFYAVLTGQTRPFREPGLPPEALSLTCASGSCNFQFFDGNPERLRVDSDGLEATVAADVPTGWVMRDVTGPLDFAARAYTILPETPLSAPAAFTFESAPAALLHQFTVASLNLDRFYDATADGVEDVVLSASAFQTRLAKASLTIRTVLNTPDIVALQEVEHLGALQALAQQVDADATAAGQPAPQYQPIVYDGIAEDGLDVGFLVKNAGGRVEVLSVDQLTATFTDPSTHGTHVLNDRPSVALRATVRGPASQLPQTLTVVVDDLRPLDGTSDAGGQFARAQRQAQAEFLADYVHGRLINDPNEAIVTVGGYHAFEFNDGVVDVVGTIRGLPAPGDQVVVASPDLLSPDLLNAGDLAAAGERYSRLSGGNAEAVDHVLVSANLASQLTAVSYVRVNADFPETLRGDSTTPGRLSDHDPVVAYFTFPADRVSPVIVGASRDLVTEATGSSGAVVTFDTPTATDNLDASVDVLCAPASGSTFAVGHTGVTCSAQDLAGNSASASFTVTVQDTTAPVLTLPVDPTVQAPDASGIAVWFASSATDAVTPSPIVTCTPASGSTFAVGATVVTCAAADAAGNVATASFTVTVTAPEPPPPDVVHGRMGGAGVVDAGSRRAWFAFDVRESAHAERGWLMLRIRDGSGRPDKFLAAHVTDVAFANSDGYSPGQYPRSGVDSVMFSGVGMWNWRSGYRFVVAASDRGEPGTGLDTFTVTIYSPTGAVVETLSDVLRDGNIQSRR